MKAINVLGGKVNLAGDVVPAENAIGQRPSFILARSTGLNVYPKTKTAALRRARLIAITTGETVTVKRSDDDGKSWKVIFSRKQAF